MGHPLYMQLYGGRQIPRMGLSHAAIAPYDAYPTAEKYGLVFAFLGDLPEAERCPIMDIP